MLTDDGTTKLAKRDSSAPGVSTNRNRSGTRLAEAGIWPRANGAWKQLYGSFYELGASIEWHDFQTPSDFDWARSFHPDSLEFCLNLAGEGSVATDSQTVCFSPATAGFYVSDGTSLQATRKGMERHRFITVEFSRDFLRQHLSQCDGSLNPLVESFISNEAPSPGLGEIHPLTAEQQAWVGQLLHPPTTQGARSLWYQGALLEILARFCFERLGEDELFCDRQKRLATERVDKVIALLREHLAEPLSLEEIGRRVGCSPFHLSRTFSRETGLTMPQYLRKLRMEKAAELLRTGKFNVTEAALEVGYSSLSHFSQAFCQTMGCCPGLYPLPRSAGNPLGGAGASLDHKDENTTGDRARIASGQEQ